MPQTLDEWLGHLTRQHPLGIELGLERVAEVGKRLGLEARLLAKHVISVAGTNGKGSTVAMLDSLARSHGLTTATYTSPHLLRYNERLCFDGVEATDATLIKGFAAVETARLTPTAICLTYFEMGTLAALHAIAARPPDLAILEVGLGGRLDAVNVIDADLAVVTTVAQDHADFLGSDLEVIGWEKAGIMRAGHPVVLGSPALPASVAQTATRLGAPHYTLGREFKVSSSSAAKDHLIAASSSWNWQGTSAQGEALSLDNLPDPGLPLNNAASALQALALIGLELTPDACRQGLSQARLAGRMQWRDNWCLDVGHNPHAAQYLATRLAARPCRGRRICLLGMLEDKDAAGVIAALTPVIDAWLPVSLEGERGRPAESLAVLLEARDQRILRLAESPRVGADWLAQHLSGTDEVLVCGSFYTVAEVLAGWQAAESEEPICRGEENEIRNA
ncbi:bifunctional tetrahydrofolate synthase/dihydrofolate synthase [Pistricoccus aurantiacus]|uniref:Dihydrofolate synthase/folylpolyglutamate synthase n=1 Tax=Pistricoccus aurantiacus TaxID=1883414 RepID=A0A5B8STB5_9GAMM|nr:bifunctional tetrahydrofolate synthase/dihydrofolate synthase [Pistricoccus aurantiacus]QEA40352.1 bifunctional tetrahydrofolate synthase/dihydrofolate synthase [Pistricoccus aurantiacus]